jgi:hypothetical protein
MTWGGLFPLVWAVFAALSLMESAYSAGLLINESLANEPGSVTSLEWVELLNWPDTGTGMMSLNGYRFIDGNDTTQFDTTLTVPPGGFVILARKPVGAGSFESYWGNNSGVWGDAPGESFPVVAAKISLRNTNDTVTLISPSGDTSRMLWTRDGDDGVSFERVRPNHNDGQDNFAFCRDSSGSTPGQVNSVFPTYNDLSLDSMIVVPQDPTWGQPITVTMYVTNTGLAPSSDVTIDLLESIDLSNPGGGGVAVASGDVPALDEGASTSVAIIWADAPPGFHLLTGRIRADGDSLNNSSVTLVTVRHSRPLLIISEFLANPTTDGPGEWVEISSQADIPINLTATKLGDSSDVSAMLPFITLIPPGAYLVLCESETAFRNFYPGFDGWLAQVSPWRELNNSGDRIRLVGAAGEIIDSVSFRRVYDANHSVERLELSAAFAGEDDWAESIDPSGATPGRENSVKGALAGPFRVSVTPNPIYLSAGQPAQIDYRVQIGEQLTLKIFDRAGHLVRTIADNAPAATGSVTWDGTDDNGGQVRPGPYILLARSEPQGASSKLVIVVGP